MVFCCFLSSTGRRRDLQVDMFSEFKLSSKALPKQRSVLSQPQHCMQTKAEAAWFLHSSQPKPVWWLQRKYPSPKDQRDALEAKIPQILTCVADLHILFIHPAVNTLSWVQTPDTHPKWLGRSTACIFLPVFQIPTHCGTLILSNPARGSLLGLPVDLLLWPLGDSTSNKMEIWERGGRSVTQGQH